MTELLRKHQAEQQTRRQRVAVAEPEATRDEFEHRALKEDRNRLQTLVGAWSRRTGKPHATIHVELRKVCGGPAVAEATREQIQNRISRLEGWFVGRR